MFVQTGLTQVKECQITARHFLVRKVFYGVYRSLEVNLTQQDIPWRSIVA